MTDVVTVQVAKGIKVHVTEVEAVRDADPRIPDDRQVIIGTPKSMKIAIKGSDEKLQSKASVVLTCG